MNKTATKLVRNKLHFNDNLDKTTNLKILPKFSNKG